MRIVLDAMGGDYAPRAPVEGALLYDKEFKGRDQVILVGNKAQIEKELQRHHFTTPRNLKIIHASQVITMHEPPATAIRRKKDSSMVKGLQMIKEGLADAFVSAGSTGAQMAASLLILGRIPGVHRPALGAFLPREGGVVLLIDVGANADCRPVNLLQFGLMGSIFIEYIYDVPHPRVGLLNIGEEPGKGNELTRAAYDLMKEHIPDFIGNVEGRNVLHEVTDVIVTDGFTGNVILKFAESILEVFGRTFKRSVGKNIFSLTGAFLVRHAFRDMKRNFDYQEYGGVPLLGVDGISIICHGSSSPKALKNAIKVARLMGEKQVNRHIQQELKTRGMLWEEKPSLQG